VGGFCLNEKLSYVFEKPFDTGFFSGAFVGTPGSFTVVAVNQNLNLGAVGVNFMVAVGHKNPWKFNLSYEGEFGSNYWSNDIFINIAKEF